MEKTREIRLTYSKGMTSVPSDILCDDNELSLCDGMIPDGGDWKPWQKPQEIGNLSSGELIFVHNIKGQRHYLFNKNRALTWSDGEEEHTVERSVIQGDISGVESIGNIVVLSTTEGFGYYLWRGDEYKYLGDHIPVPSVTFSMKRTASKVAYASYEGIVFFSTDQQRFWIIDKNPQAGEKGKQYDYDNLIVGLYEESRKKLEEEGYFTKPFAVRYALKMYDGTYNYISTPVWMFPVVSQSTFFNIVDKNNLIFANTLGARLWVESATNYSDWEDLVQGISVFVSKGIDIYDTSIEHDIPEDAVYMWFDRDINDPYFLERRDGCHDKYETGDAGHITEPGNRVTFLDTLNALGSEWAGWGGYEDLDDVAHGHLFQYWQLKKRNKEDILKDMRDTGNFFHLFDIPTNNVFSQFSLYAFKKLSVITSLPALKEDDYFSTSKIKGAKLFSYNGKIHRYGFSRGLPEGSTGFSNWKYLNLPTGIRYDYLAVVRCQHSYTILEESYGFSSIEVIDRIFYYPDPNCKEITLYVKSGGNWYFWKRFKMEEHPTLHLSQSIDNLPSEVDTFPSPEGDPVSEDTLIKDKAFEEIENELHVSVPSNPFVYLASGVVSFQGKVLGIAALTTALSEGQFGQFPLVAFTTKGIWSVALNGSGEYVASQPVSREVLRGDICMLDGLVLFASDNGLMQLNGRKVTNLSARLREFSYGGTVIDMVEYIKASRIVYDSKSSCVLLIGSPIMYYHLPSGVFGVVRGVSYARAVEDFPDCIIQDTEGVLHSLIDRPLRELDASTYSGVIASRPLKFGSVYTLKSLRELRNLHTGYVVQALTIESSNDLIHWQAEHSIKGTGKRYFRFTHTLSNMNADSSFAGVLLKVQDKRTLHYQ